jgi:hypothetical protein
MFLEIALVIGFMFLLTAVASVITVVMIVLSEIKSDPNEHID